MRESEKYIVRYSYFHGKLHPMLQFALACNGRTVTVEAYVDSGAAYSLFSPNDAEKLDIDYRSGKLQWIQGVGGTFVPAYLHRLRMFIGRISFEATVGFSARIGVGFNLLGRRDVFKRLAFTFNDNYNFLLISDASDVPAAIKARLGLDVN